MILSMTGFAAVAAELPGVSLAVELRSVNHRYLDVTVKLPDELRALEPAMREKLAGVLKRGKVECRVALNRTALGSAALAVDLARVGQLAAAASEVTRAVPRRPRCPCTKSCAGPACWPSPRCRRRSSPRMRRRCSTRRCATWAPRVRAKVPRRPRCSKACCAGIEAQVARVAPRIPAVHAAFNDKLAIRLRDAGLDPERGSLEAGTRVVRHARSTSPRNSRA